MSRPNGLNGMMLKPTKEVREHNQDLQAGLPFRTKTASSQLQIRQTCLHRDRRSGPDNSPVPLSHCPTHRISTYSVNFRIGTVRADVRLGPRKSDTGRRNNPLQRT